MAPQKDSYVAFVQTIYTLIISGLPRPVKVSARGHLRDSGTYISLREVEITNRQIRPLHENGEVAARAP
jgi:hypothetical protein